MKPIIILPPDVMSAEDIAMLRENGLCVVISSDPAKVRFVDPIPAISNRTEMEHAAIALSRKILSGDQRFQGDKQHYAAMYVDLLVKGTTLDANQVNREQDVYDAEKYAEIRKIAREEARAEREAKKAAKK